MNIKRLFKFLSAVMLGLAIFFTHSSYALVTFGESAGNIMRPMSVATNAIYGLCYIIGTAFFLGGLVQYRNYRRNPQQVRFGTVILLIVTGIILVVLPFLAKFSSSSSIGH